MPISSEEIETQLAALREAFGSTRTQSLAWRQRQLDGVIRMLHEREAEILDALNQDLGKCRFEAYSSEIARALASAKYQRKYLKRWMKPRRVRVPLVLKPTSASTRPQPKGLVLILSPWNYPFELAVTPLIGALAAGNCVVLKPSETSPCTSALLARLLPEYLDTECVQVFEGGPELSATLLQNPFDHIFFTGGPQVGRRVLEAAAKFLTPTTLELGGKNPCVVDASADLRVAARRILWGKTFNAGQTCVAPDYVLVHHRVHDELLRQLSLARLEFWGGNPKTSPDFARIVNAHHFQRVTQLIDGAGELVFGGETDSATFYVEPTVFKNTTSSAPIMSEEIFGPLLPVLKMNDMPSAIDFINARPKPLAVYLFTTNTIHEKELALRTSSGALGINQCLLHAGIEGLPWGGVGESGFGAYHGKASFECFSHVKSVTRASTSFDPPLLYPPYSELALRLIRRFL